MLEGNLRSFCLGERRQEVDVHRQCQENSVIADHKSRITVSMATSSTCFPLKRPGLTSSFLYLVLFVSCCLASVNCGSGAMLNGSSMTKVSFMTIGMASNRRKLAENSTTMNSTQTLQEDADVLLLFKAAITRDPYNVTRYWKPIGRRQVINPCRPWVGITCTRRRVTAINLYNRSLQGSLISALGRLSQLQVLNLSGNQFSGTIPSELGLVSSLQILDIGSNNLTDALPSSLGDLKNLTSLDASNNKLTRTIPTSIGSLSTLRNLNLSRNNLSGTLPSAFGQLNLLEALDIAQNYLNGTIPQQLTNCTKLRDIDLSDNDLQGVIPFQNLKNLTVLHLQNNLLEGNITSITTFPALEDLDLTNNRLSGSIPQAIRSTSLKRNFLLAQNELTGSIPDKIGELNMVTRIDFSSNKLSGSIPEAISNCISLIKLNVASNSLTGKFSVRDGSLPNLTQLNVSHNILQGSLPTLEHLINLKVFDGSFNNFSGAVPSSFVNFTSLLYLNVSSNRLSGELPLIISHDSVTAESFLNNSELCGSILNKSCGSGKIATSTIIYIALGSAAGLIVLVSVLFYVIACYKGRKGKGSRHSAQVSAELQLKLTLDEILTATNRFSEANYIGAGKVGTVYKGVLPDETVVAVKRLEVTCVEGKEEADKALDAELEVLGHIRHRSLVRVLGYCSTVDIKALVLDHMPNGSLESLLYSPRDSEVIRAFDWTLRFKIAMEVAEGLRFLHHESSNPIVHGDVKPGNILFDAEMEAKIGDFGVARILTQQGFSSTLSPSTPVTTAHGYMPPEIAESGVPSKKGDVYSFGIILLEMITGRSPDRLEPGQTLPEWVRATVSNSKALENVLDPQLMTDLATHQQKIAMVLGVALLCTRSRPEERPHMDDAYKMLVHIQTKTTEGEIKQTSRRRGWSSGRRISSAGRKSSASEVIVVTQKQQQQQQPPQQALPYTPSLSDWTPPNRV